MYAVIRTGGKQYKVSPGDRLRVEKIDWGETTLRPLLVVDGDSVTSDGAGLESLPVVVKVLEEGRGKKINAGKYKSKSRYRRRWGHRQDYHLIEVQSIGDARASDESGRAGQGTGDGEADEADGEDVAGDDITTTVHRDEEDDE